MNNFIIEGGILKRYNGMEHVVVVPDGVEMIGGCISEEDSTRRGLRGDPIGYKAFYENKTVEEIYLPDSVKVIGFKSFEHCSNLKIMAFSNNVTEFECNSMLGCDSLKRIIFRGTIFEFSLLSIDGRLDLDEVICIDGVMRFHREHYIDVLHFPGTRKEWEEFKKAEWLKRRAKEVICTDD